MSNHIEAVHLLEFTVENYRSLRDTVVLSMISAKADSKLSQFPTFDGKRLLLSDVALYGANASGKSNLIRALFIFKNSITGENGLFKDEPIEPFLLDEMSRYKNTTMEAVFEYKRRTYVYGFQYSYQQNRIKAEWLKFSLASNKKFTKIFERTDDELFINSKLPLSEHGISRSFAKLIKPDELFVTTLTSKSEWTLAKEVSNAWANCFVSNTLFHDPIANVARMLYGQPNMKDVLLPLLQEADLYVNDVMVKKDDSDNLRIYLGHTYENKKSIKTVWFDIYNQESAGTQKFFSFALPLLNSLQHGSVVVLDELGSTLHPDLLKFVVKLFRDPKRNPRHAQLIMTTHDTSLMRGSFARDQIYFTHKSSDQSTRLYALSDIKGVRKNLSNLDERYLRGDFGAVPTLIKV